MRLCEFITGVIQVDNWKLVCGEMDAIHWTVGETTTFPRNGSTDPLSTRNCISRENQNRARRYRRAASDEKASEGTTMGRIANATGLSISVPNNRRARSPFCAAH